VTNDIDSKPLALAEPTVRPARRARPAETIKVRIAPPGIPGATEAAIGHLIEEWAALTYACMVESAMVAQAANQPMHPPDEPASEPPGGAVGAA